MSCENHRGGLDWVGSGDYSELSLTREALGPTLSTAHRPER